MLRLLWIILGREGLQLVLLRRRESSMLNLGFSFFLHFLLFKFDLKRSFSILPYRYAKDILQKEMLPHVGVGEYCETKKAYYFG